MSAALQPSTSAALLEIAGLTVAYGSRPVLRGVDLAVPAGQLVCVLGPSGGGKSTLLRAIAGLEEPAGGTVRLAGRDLAGVPAHERGVGLMFQDYALFPHRDVGHNVAFGLRMRGEDAGAIRQRVAELLTLVGLPGAERRAVSQLSGGEQQRVALARALAPRPRLLMLDEPMGSLDRSLRERLPEELRGIFTELGLTVLYVTHDQDEALSVADRVAVLDDGRIVADDPPERLWRHPPSAWVAGFLGFRNVAPATVRRGVAISPWGEFVLPGAADGVVTVVLRPEALTLGQAGGITGTVEARRFRGDHVRVVVMTDARGRLELEVRGDPPEVGSRVSVSVDPTRVDVLPGSDAG
jgi:thiamine transport system ATP-binding protein